MKCPHCLHQVTVAADTINLVHDEAGKDHVATMWGCPNPECRKLVLMHRVGTIRVRGQGRAVVDFIDAQPARLMVPRSGARPVPASVPNLIADDYREAAEVMPISPKASAALSRRCLQNTIRETKGIKKGSLEQEIDEVIAKGMVSSALGEQLDAVRQIGNFAAHPIKSTSTGDIVAIEPGEAEWNLDVLDGLFEEWFVQPAALAARKAASIRS